MKQTNGKKYANTQFNVNSHEYATQSASDNSDPRGRTSRSEKPGLHTELVLVDNTGGKVFHLILFQPKLESLNLLHLFTNFIFPFND